MCICTDIRIYVLWLSACLRVCTDILLSLVRTERVGHLRDVRRLIVAVSRARLGKFS